ncbi:MAG: ArsA-related P-loop ATPase [Solirubrobacteraceae bacterium]
MDSLLERQLVVVTGKGGTGKTTIAGAVALLAARRGARAVVLDAVGDGRRLARLFAEAELPGLRSLAIDPDEALEEWMRRFAGRLPTRMLASRSSFQYFAAAAPGARELVCIAKVASLVEEHGRSGELVVLDAPASGHALALLTSPQTFSSIVRVGPLGSEVEAISTLLADDARTGYLAVAAASEMAITETIELEEQLGELRLHLHAVIVNAVLKRRFSGEELARIGAAARRLRGSQRTLALAASDAARTAHERGRLQHNQLARLRRHGLTPLQVPFVFGRDLDVAAVERIVDELDGKL